MQFKLANANFWLTGCWKNIAHLNTNENYLFKNLNCYNAFMVGYEATKYSIKSFVRVSEENIIGGQSFFCFNNILPKVQLNQWTVKPNLRFWKYFVLTGCDYSSTIILRFVLFTFTFYVFLGVTQQTFGGLQDMPWRCL